jgi:6-phospho-beta-glucosidase
LKLTLIGGGSVRTYYFVESLLKYCERLHITKLSVMDTDPRKLKYFGALAMYLAARAPVSPEIELTADLKQAVLDADFIVTTIRAGNDEARCQDERIALSHGLIGQETTGAGGFSYAMRSIPAMLNICEAARKYANPGAVVFNFTNPSGLVTQAMRDAGYRVIGICDNATGIKMDLAKALGIGGGEMFVRVYGLNHLSWADRVEIGGKNILPELMANESFIEAFHPFAYFDRGLIRQLGKIPNGYLYYYYHRERALENMQKSPETRGEAILRINREMLAAFDKLDVETQLPQMEETFRHYMGLREGSYMRLETGGGLHNTMSLDVNALGIPQLRIKGGSPEIYEGYAGVAFNCIQSMVENKPIDLALNVPNNGAIPGLEDGDVVEVTCMVDKNGVKPVHIGEIPEDELNLIRLIKRYEKLSVLAAQERSISLAAQALMQHPLVASYSLAKKLAVRYAAVNEPYTGAWRH